MPQNNQANDSFVLFLADDSHPIERIDIQGVF